MANERDVVATEDTDGFIEGSLDEDGSLIADKQDQARQRGGVAELLGAWVTNEGHCTGAPGTVGAKRAASAGAAPQGISRQRRQRVSCPGSSAGSIAIGPASQRPAWKKSQRGPK